MLLTDVLGDGLQADVGTDGLRDEVVATSVEGVLAVAVEGIGGQGNNGQVGLGKAYLARGLKTVHNGHLHVHKYHIGMFAGSQFYCFLTIAGTEEFVVLFENVGHQHVVAVVVFCYKNSLHKVYLIKLFYR